MAISVVRYDPSWPAQFHAEAAALTGVLRPWLAGPVEHIGSTSVPGLDAKPILDMMARVHDLTSASDAIPLLSSRGYIHYQHRPATLPFYKQWPGDPGQDSHQARSESGRWEQQDAKLPASVQLHYSEISQLGGAPGLRHTARKTFLLKDLKA